MDDATARPSLILKRLVIQDFRNIERIDVELAPRLNVIAGNNGQGKTSLLEAAYVVATSRSFRTSKLSEIRRHGCETASVRATFEERARGDESAVAREQTTAIQHGRTVAMLDGNRPTSLGAYATKSPVLAFHPQELELSTGGAQGRRTLLDRVALFLSPASSDDRSRYTRALRARQDLLRKASGYGRGGAELEAFEELCAIHGAQVTLFREQALKALEPQLTSAFSKIGASDTELTVAYQPAGSSDVTVAREALHASRGIDAKRTTARFGPHRDDLAIFLNGHPGRKVASQGQHRAITLALKLAEAAAISEMRRLQPVMLLDDVSSELDAERTTALFRFLACGRHQIVLTTTRPELIDTLEVAAFERRDFVVRNGVLHASYGPSTKGGCSR